MFAVNALRNAAKLLNDAAAIVAEAEDDNLEYADECIARALAEVEAAGYDLDDLVSYARNVA